MEKRLDEDIRKFLAVSYGSGYGSCDGSGDGDGYGDGSGSGSGYGSCDGSGDGSGYGSGSGSGYGDGYGYGSGYGYGYGDGYGYGYGDGYGDGYGSGIPEFNGQKVYRIDGVQTLIDSVHGNYAKGHILQSDFTLTPCYIARDGNFFAHGKTLAEAVRDAAAKRIENSPLEERIAKFREEWPDPDVKISALLLWEWHHILTGSCEAGRNAFAKDHGINVLEDSFTVREFIELTCNAYGSDAIRKLAEAYGIVLTE